MRITTGLRDRRLLTALLAAALAVLLLAPVATANPQASAFPGTPGAIAFVSNREDSRVYHVYRMSADGFGQTRLTEGSGLNFSPTWSADGTKIAYTAYAGFGTPGEIYRMNSNGSGGTNLTNASIDDDGPAFSPANNNRIAFVSKRVNNQYDVYLMTLGQDGQTTSLVRLTTSDAKDYSPAISPDGRRIAFVSDRDGDEDIYIMKLAPEGPRNVPVKITKNTRPDPNGAPYMLDTSPDWSPDGTQIVFASDRNGTFDVYRIKASREGKRNRPVNLTKNRTAYDEDPAWSPDGKKIAFVSNRNGNLDVWRINAADGSNPTNLTNNPALDLMPAWQPLP